MSVFPVVLDVYGGTLRDTLLRALEEDLYRGYWTSEIIDEVTRNLLNDGRMTPVACARLEQTLSAQFPEAYVTGYESLLSSMRNNADDRHVLAAAVYARAQIIVTFNLKHFPAHALQPFGVEAQHPDVFLSDLFDLQPAALVGIVRQQAADCRRPPQTVERVLARLRALVPTFVGLVERAIADQAQAGAMDATEGTVF